MKSDRSVWILWLGMIVLFAPSLCWGQLPERFQELAPFVDANTALVGVYQPGKLDPKNMKEWARDIGMPFDVSWEEIVLAKSFTELGVKRVYVVVDVSQIVGGAMVFVIPTNKPAEVTKLFPAGAFETKTSSGCLIVSSSASAIESLLQLEGQPSKMLCKALEQVKADHGCAISMGGRQADTEGIRQSMEQVDKRLKMWLDILISADYLTVEGGIPTPMNFAVTFPSKEKAEASLASIKQLYQSVIDKTALPKWEIHHSTLLFQIPDSKVLVQTIKQISGMNGSSLESGNNLKKLMLAIHNYYSAHNMLPPQAVADDKGTKLLSWRVLLLPYVGEADLFKEFHMNEAWDSEHNRKLIERMPKIFASSSAILKAGETCYQAPLTANSLFGFAEGPVDFPKVKDGTSNTVAIVETHADAAVIWTKPEDATVDPLDPLSIVREADSTTFWAGLCDGSVQRFNNRMLPQTFLNLIGFNDGKIIDGKDAGAHP